MTVDAPRIPGRSALVLGATGLVGGHCIDLLLNDTLYDSVTILTRRPTGRSDPKLAEHTVDFEVLAAHAARFAVDDVFSCLGTTIRKAGSRAAFLRVDVDYPVEAARLAAAAGARRHLLVSSVGADPKSRFAYTRAKGEVEERIRSMPIDAVWSFRPSLLLGDRAEVRTGERVAEIVLRASAPALRGPLRRYRAVAAREVAAAMIHAASQDTPGRIVESEEIPVLADLYFNRRSADRGP